jgi:hypothetical protein
MISFFQHFLQILQNQEFTCAKMSTVINRNFPTAVCAYQVYTGFHYTHGRTGLGGGGGAPAPPPSLLGKQSQSGNIRSTVGQYWLIIKKNGTNSVNFVGNFVISGKLVGCFEKFRKIFGPLKWYTYRNFFGDGGGVVKINFLRKNFLALVGQNLKKSGRFVSTPLIFSFRYAHDYTYSHSRQFLGYSHGYS